MEDVAVTRFREYLTLKSVHPDPDYDSCISWIKNQAEEIGLEFNIKEFDGTKSFAVWLTWRGTEPSLKSILINSHIDVVPVDAKKWKHPPFSAHKEFDGNIYARGAQDMKSVGVQYLEAIRNLKAQGFTPLRTVHVSFVPDEELGGSKGMKIFAKSQEFRNLNVGFGLDEGVAAPDDFFHLFYGERILWQVKFTARGQTGHGSLLFENTAAEKIQTIINKMLALRTTEKDRLKTDGAELGDVTSINMTMLGGGLQPNVVPPELTAVFDIRITPSWNFADFENVLKGFCTEAGKDVTFEFVVKCDAVQPTRIDDSNIWWATFKAAINELGYKLHPEICPGATDARWLRQEGIPSLGFSPMNKTPTLLHDHNEFLNEDVFLAGIPIYEKILREITQIPQDL